MKYKNLRIDSKFGIPEEKKVDDKFVNEIEKN